MKKENLTKNTGGHKMTKTKKVLVCIAILTLGLSLTGCSLNKEDVKSQQELSKKLEKNQPTPTDFNYSIERYNLIKRAYWVNGDKDRANAMQPPVKLPLGHVVLLSKGVVVMQLDVAGKVSSLNSTLTPPSECYTTGSDARTCDWVADVDGSYSSNDDGIFFFTPQNQYVEWKGEYLYSDIPLTSADSIVKG